MSSLIPRCRWRPKRAVPFRPLAALATIMLDNIFGVFEIFDPLVVVLTSLGVGVLGTVTTMLLQRYLSCYSIYS